MKKMMKLNPYTLYLILIDYFGYQRWWPIDKNYHKKNNSDNKSEIIFGTILTQNSSWNNVEKSLFNLKKNRKLNIKDISEIDIKLLQNLIAPSGFYKQKSDTLKNLSLIINNNYHNNLSDFFNRELIEIRNELLSIRGIGPETADSILLYAGNKPIFVVDKYTKRICKRLLFDVEIEYLKIQSFFENNLKKNVSVNNLVKIYKEFHALIVELCKKFCKKKPQCKNCVIKEKCMYNTYQIIKL